MQFQIGFVLLLVGVGAMWKGEAVIGAIAIIIGLALMGSLEILF